MRDENVDLPGVVAQLQGENERLRSELAKARRFDFSVPLEKIKLEAANIVQSAYFWIGYFVALILSFIIYRFVDNGPDREGD